MPLFKNNNNTSSVDVEHFYKVSEVKQAPRKRAEQGKNPQEVGDMSLEMLIQSIKSKVENFRGRDGFNDAEFNIFENEIQQLVYALLHKRK